jgi:hypothetical protein
VIQEELSLNLFWKTTTKPQPNWDFWSALRLLFCLGSYFTSEHLLPRMNFYEVWDCFGHFTLPDTIVRVRGTAGPRHCRIKGQRCRCCFLVFLTLIFHRKLGLLVFGVLVQSNDTEFSLYSDLLLWVPRGFLVECWESSHNNVLVGQEFLVDLIHPSGRLTGPSIGIGAG